MNKQQMRALAFAATLGLVWWTGGCHSGTLEGREPGQAALAEDGAAEASTPSTFVEREFWLALSEEPGWHLNQARARYLDGDAWESAGELEKVAAILNFETRHSHSQKERGLLLASVAELREVSRQLRLGTDPNRGGPSLAELDRVSALAFRTIAAQDVALGREALEDGDARMAGRYIGETVKALQDGFERSGIVLGHVLSSDLEKAQGAASSLETEGDGTREEGFLNLDLLDDAVLKLGDILTERRK
ncbi:MAG: hypothetical protein PVJ76_05255 [Gemmatimonadota bacterium]|jgi:hypothetical protein